MEKNNKISVIIPIYNVERYLPECIDSILEQTYSNIEIVLVDDGSPDNADKICDEYATRDPRILAYHIPNGGVAKARQFGVENSTGQYILFVDADDYIPRNAIELLVNQLSHDTDIVIGNITRFYNYKNITIEESINPRTYQNLEYIHNLLLGNITSGPWAKLFKRELFTKDSFPSAKRGQDFLMNIDLGCRIKNAVSTSDNVYYYRIESESSSLTGFIHTFDNFKIQSAIIESTLKRSNLYDKLQFEYSMALLKILFDVIKDGEYFDKNDPLILAMTEQLKKGELGVSTRIILLSFHSRLLRYIISTIYKNIRTGKVIRIRQMIKKVQNR